MDYDYNKLLNSTDGDNDLANELIEIFIDETPKMIETMRQAITENKLEELHRAAHTLKGQLASMGANNALGLTLKLESMGINENLNGAETVFEELKTVLNSLLVQLKNQEYISI